MKNFKFNWSFGAVCSPNQTNVEKPIDFWLRKGKAGGEPSRPRINRETIESGASRSFAELLPRFCTMCQTSINTTIIMSKSLQTKDPNCEIYELRS